MSRLGSRLEELFQERPLRIGDALALLYHRVPEEFPHVISRLIRIIEGGAETAASTAARAIKELGEDGWPISAEEIRPLYWGTRNVRRN